MTDMSINSNLLNEFSEYNRLVSYYEKYKNEPFENWLEFDSTFKNPGKQGLVGILKVKNENDKCVFKISQYINYLAQHESIVMEGLNEISGYCPHFCKSIGVVKCKVDPKSRKEGNPFNSNAKYPIEKEVLLCEYIEESYKLCNYIRSEEKISEEILYSAIKQILMAIVIAQHKKKFTHYDLHSNNIMMKKCNKDLVFLYVIDNDNQFCVPTFGHYPVIIDFGFSYIENMDDGETDNSNTVSTESNENNNTLAPSISAPNMLPFREVMMNTDILNISLFYADWCGHCKKFMTETWGELKEKYGSSNDVQLNQIDCTNVKSAIETPAGKNVEGFPTLILNYKDKNGKYVEEEYNGPRSFQVIASVIDKFTE
jgi:thiol-disulfide isomerase/thioredoxin